MKTTIINNVRREIRSAMDDNGLLDTINSRYSDYDFDTTFVVAMQMPDSDQSKEDDVVEAEFDDSQFDILLAEAEAIAEAEFDHIIGQLRKAAGMINDALGA